MPKPRRTAAHSDRMCSGSRRDALPTVVTAARSKDVPTGITASDMVLGGSLTGLGAVKPCREEGSAESICQACQSFGKTAKRAASWISRSGSSGCPGT